MAAQRGAMPRAGEVACPDPAVHGSRMQRGGAGGRDPFGADGKLSAASAAASLKYAKPHELPSFPSVGIDTSSGNRAANLANQNQKPFEYWKPTLSSSASKAAILASQDAGKNNLWRPSATQQGHSAASIAMAKRNRASSTTSTSYSEFSHIGDEANDAARLKNMHGAMPREMFTEHPPVAIEVEEKRRQDALRASAMSMAKQMFEAQRRANDPNVPMDAKTMVSGYVNLQEVAQRRANERLAKIDPDGVLAYREHYGIGSQPAERKSMSARLRAWPGEAPKDTKANARDDDSSDEDADEVQAVKIRQQMNKFSDSLAGLDARKRETDREAVRLLAEKRVQARLHDIDEKVFHETGKASPAIQKDWEAKARQKAVADSEQRNKTSGKVHIGGGKYMDQSEINAIAAARVQPTLDEITATAQEQRARDEQNRQDAEHRRFVLESERQRERDNKAEVRRVADEQKFHARNLRDSEKFKRDEENRKTKDERRAKEREEKIAREGRIKVETEERKKRQAEEKVRMEEERLARGARTREEREAKEAGLREAATERERQTGATQAIIASPVAGVISPEAQAELDAIVKREAGDLPVQAGDATETLEDDDIDAVFVEAPNHATETAENGEMERVTTAREYSDDEDRGTPASGVTGYAGGKPITVDVESADLKRLQVSALDSDSDAAGVQESSTSQVGRDDVVKDESSAVAEASTPIPSTARETKTTQTHPSASRGFLDRTTSGGASGSRRESIKGFLGKFRRSSRIGQTGSGSLPTLATVAAVPAGVAAVEASRKLASGSLEPAIENSNEAAVETAIEPATMSSVESTGATYLKTSTEPATMSSVEPAEAAYSSYSETAAPILTKSATSSSSPQAAAGTAHQNIVLAAIFGGAPATGGDGTVERDVYTPTERATTERATSIRSAGLYSEPSHQARERFAERSDSPDISSISSEEEEAQILQATRGRSGRSEVSDDEFEEARDRFDETGSRISFARDGRDESPARNSSKFQEQLS